MSQSGNGEQNCAEDGDGEWQTVNR